MSAMVEQRFLRRLLSLPRKFARDGRGVAAVEFAIIFPFMALLYLGSYEITQAVAVKRLVTLTASTVANVTTQYASISQSATMPDILKASTTVLTPYPVAKATVVVSVIAIDANKNATVAWSCAMTAGGASCGTGSGARSPGSSVVIPAALAIPNTQVVWGETTYRYVPLIDFLHIGTLNLYSSVFMLPRSTSGKINLVA